MKIAIAFHGLSHHYSIYGPKPKRKIYKRQIILSSYTYSLENYKKYLNINNHDIYFHTYRGKILNEKEIVKDLKPIKYSITSPIINEMNKNKIQRAQSKINSIKEVFKLIPKNKYDIILLTRFDLKFKKNPIKLIHNKQYNKNNIGFGFHCEKIAPEGHVDDNVMIVPSNKINLFIKVLKLMNKNYNLGTEDKYPHIIGKYLRNKLDSDFSLLINEKSHIWKNSLYDILKIKTDKQEGEI